MTKAENLWNSLDKDSRVGLIMLADLRQPQQVADAGWNQLSTLGKRKITSQMRKQGLI